jgi:hypothetical protein
VLKLIHHTAVFGPIDLEFDQPVIRVGSSEDNDLVVPHPSVKPRHCLLVFRSEKVLCLRPDEAIPSSTELESLPGPELGAGDWLSIGDVKFSLAHSAQTVAVPEPQSAGSTAEAQGSEGETGAGAEEGQARYYCSHCRVWIPEAQVKRVGLVGRAKRDLCPRCSGLLETGWKRPSPRRWPRAEPPYVAFSELGKWCALQDLNLRPLPCEGSALPLS